MLSMRSPESFPGINKHSPGHVTLFLKKSQWQLAQLGDYLCCPFIAVGIRIFRVHLLGRVHGSGVDLFQTVGFFADVLDLINPHMSPLQHAYSLFLTELAVGVRTLRLGMEFIFPDHVAVGLHARCFSVAMMPSRGDAIAFP